jgi:hypothetical protein
VAELDPPIQGAARPYAAKSVGGNVFTEEEMDLLIKGAADIMNTDEDKTISAWEAFAVEASISLMYLPQSLC